VIQVLLCNALSTMMFFRFDFWYRLGAMFNGDVPFIQLECQNCAMLPFPTVTIVDALNNALSALSVGMSNPDHGLPSSFHLYQYQQSLRALSNRSKSRIPSPPKGHGHASRWPVNQTVTATNLLQFLPLPEETPHPVNMCNKPFLCLKNRQMVNWLCGKDTLVVW
jgi:hypothetical protein